MNSTAAKKKEREREKKECKRQKTRDGHALEGRAKDRWRPVSDPSANTQRINWDGKARKEGTEREREREREKEREYHPRRSLR